MTATLATPVDARAAKFAEMSRREAAFAASRRPCPTWCDGTCDTEGHFGDAVLHHCDATTVPITGEAGPGTVTVGLWQHDSLDEPSDSGVVLDVTTAKWIFPGLANFTAAQARELAVELLRHADRIEPEFEVPVTEIRVGDWLPVGDQWFRIYSIDVDEPTDSVQLYTTVDWDTLPEFGGDEEPHVFDINDVVRIRRDGAR
jgi:hypothetical protein